MTLSSAQQDLQQRARALARETIAPRAAEVDRTEQYPWENVKALNDAGFFGMTIPKQYGGPGLGFLEAALVVDEVAQACGVSGIPTLIRYDAEGKVTEVVNGGLRVSVQSRIGVAVDQCGQTGSVDVIGVLVGDHNRGQTGNAVESA